MYLRCNYSRVPNIRPLPLKEYMQGQKRSLKNETGNFFCCSVSVNLRKESNALPIANCNELEFFNSF